jgi:hypothetical protein
MGKKRTADFAARTYKTKPVSALGLILSVVHFTDRNDQPLPITGAQLAVATVQAQVSAGQKVVLFVTAIVTNGETGQQINAVLGSTGINPHAQTIFGDYPLDFDGGETQAISFSVETGAYISGPQTRTYALNLNQQNGVSQATCRSASIVAMVVAA